MELIYGKTKTISPEAERSIAAYRHKVFIELLGWDMPVQDGLERDQFDHEDTVYVMARNDSGAVCGCARLLPTTSPYLLSEVFPQLLNGVTPPCSPEVWELSRFATVDFSAQTTNAMSQFSSEICVELLHASIHCAHQHGAKRLITVSPLGIERLLRRMGVHAHRAGPPMTIDGHHIYACWIEIDEITITALDALSEKTYDFVDMTSGRHTIQD